jgi:hypothetical protein
MELRVGGKETPFIRKIEAAVEAIKGKFFSR